MKTTTEKQTLMKLFLVVCITIFSLPSYAAKYSLELTFVDGYTNQPISNEVLSFRIVNLDWSKKLTTNSDGTIEVNFKAKHFIKYNFDFESGNYEFQTRERYLNDSKNIQITFELYPSRKYEKSIAAHETSFLEGLSEAPDSITCLPTADDVADFLSERIVDQHLQLPFWYGDYGFRVDFVVEAVFGPNGKPYQVKIIESSDKHLNSEIIRLVRLIPEKEKTTCSGQFKRTIRFPVVIDHDNMMWEE
jgi:spore coat protein U-like protein